MEVSKVPFNYIPKEIVDEIRVSQKGDKKNMKKSKKRSNRRKKQPNENIVYTQTLRDKKCPSCGEIRDLIFFRQKSRTSNKKFDAILCPKCLMVEMKKWEEFKPSNEVQNYDKFFIENVFKYMKETTDLHFDFEECSQAIEEWRKETKNKEEEK